jgi:RNA polymerase sigma-70 factor, ECF subfamily
MSSDGRRFTNLVEPHLEALFRAAYRLTRNRSDAQDLVQDTCIRAYVNLGELRENEPVKAWLLRVLHNLFVDGARRTRRSPISGSADDTDADTSISIASPHPTPEESACAAEREERLHRAWLALDVRHRALLALRAEGYSLREIADITGMSPDSLHARLYRARQSLARHLDTQHTSMNKIRMEIAK